MRAQTLWLCGEGQGHGLVRWETRQCHGGAVPVLLIKLPSACGHHVPARPPKCPLLIHESTPHMWLSLVSSEALRHERWGKYCLCLNTQPLHQNPSHAFPLAVCPWKKEKKKKKDGDRETDTLCCETLIATAAVCLQLEREQCRSCESVCVCVCVCLRAHLWMYMLQDVHACFEPICFSVL